MQYEIKTIRVSPLGINNLVYYALPIEEGWEPFSTTQHDNQAIVWFRRRIDLHAQTEIFEDLSNDRQ